ncbi:D-alanyl-D-alanine carboxypeptidase family protein [Tsukamurella soli]|uniref:Peptidase S11 D-alanyl-D-alanine carboxypeptidase A N-terminal domain-containing protein n=1 Tax=Tsukamurella soli TaxID=644556 RepID=A0ABP8KGY2_9ACTN
MTARPSLPAAAARLTTVTALLAALAAPGIAQAEPTPAPIPPEATLTTTPARGADRTSPHYPGVTTKNTDGCPHREVPPPPVDTSEVPEPGQTAPSPLPVPSPPVGGERLGACGLILPAGAPPAPAGIDSSGWLIADITTGRVLAAKDPHGRYRPASTIKLLLAQVALRDLHLDTVVTGTPEDAAQEGDAVGIGPGGHYTVRDLLLGLLLLSGNDCAHALAMQLGGVAVTVDKMNALADSLGAHDTRVASPSGLDAPGMSTSPYDEVLILRAALADKTFRQLDETKEAFFPGYPARRDVPGDKPHPGYTMLNEDRLLFDIPGGIGGKTGYTDDAEKTYVGAVQRSGQTYVISQMFGLAYQGNSYWDQYRRLLAYGESLPPGASVGELPGDQPAVASDADGGAQAAGFAAPARATAHAARHPLTKLLLAVGGLLLVAAVVGATLRTSRRR